MIRASLVGAADAILCLLGAPAPPRDLWVAAGVRRFVRCWSAARPGSIRELQLLLGLADPAIGLDVRDNGRGQIHLLIAWKRWHSPTELWRARTAPYRLAAIAERLIEWWAPFGARVSWDLTWPGAALLAIPPLSAEGTDVTRDNKWLMKVAGELLGVRRRRPLPPQTWIGLEADKPVSRSRHEMRLANPHLDRFLFNVGPWRPALHLEKRVEKGGWTELHVTALRRVPVLELLATPGSIDEFRLDGTILRPDPIYRWPQYQRFRLAEPLQRGRLYRIACSAASAAPACIWLNPALFEAARYDSRRREYVTAFQAEPDEAWAFPDLIAGGHGITAHYQPFPIPAATPAESDEHLLARARRLMLGRRIVRRTDLECLLRELVPGIVSVRCREATWEEEREGWLISVSGVHVALEGAAAAEAAGVRTAAERFLKAHLQVAVPTRIEIVSGSK